VSSLYSSLPPLFRPAKRQDVPHPDSSSKVNEELRPDVSKQVAPPPEQIGHAYAYPWPDELPGLGLHRVGGFGPCSACGVGTWSRYGGTLLCLGCAKGHLSGR
jgi:hypothetical protein